MSEEVNTRLRMIEDEQMDEEKRESENGSLVEKQGTVMMTGE